jgi:hypothetical protein
MGRTIRRLLLRADSLRHRTLLGLTRMTAFPTRGEKGVSMAHVLPAPLAEYERKVRSQNAEDGVIEAIFSAIPPASRYFVEFGVGPNWQDPDYTRGLEGNCVFLRENGWRGLFMDGADHPLEYGVRREYVTPTNINSLLRKHGTPPDVDIISIDVDGQDLWIWMACDYRPALYILEYNPNFLTLNETCTVVFDPNFRWDGTKYYGASLGALVKVGRDKGYKLVHANGVNAFFVREDLLANPQDFPDEQLLRFVNQHIPDHFCRPWVTL